jgi:predicted Zn-dependent peptidase
MNKTRTWRAAALALFLLLPAAGMGDHAGDYLGNNVVTKKLANGITVILLNRGYAPTLAFNMSFRVGSSDESYDTIGAAHLLEHMLFKGTDTVGTTDYEKERPLLNRIEALGETIDRLKLSSPANSMLPELEARLKALQDEAARFVVNSPYDRVYSEQGGVGFNASTSRDKTGYYVELPATELELWARLESERLRKPVFREYYLERNNVIQERLMHYDSSGTGLLGEKFIAHAFEAHPYRHPIIGWRSNIGNLSLRDVRAFYYRYYIPSRMVITIVGRQDVERTLAVIEKYFGGMEPRPDPRPVAIAETPQRGEKRLTVLFESNPHLMIGWRKPTFPSRDDYACDVLSEALAGGMASPLYRSIVVDKQLASSINAWNGYPAARYENMFILSAAPRDGVSVGLLENEMYAEMERAVQALTAADLERVVNTMESRLVFGLATNTGLAHMLITIRRFSGVQYAVNYLDEIRSVTPDEVRAVMKKYFNAGNRRWGHWSTAERRAGAMRANSAMKKVFFILFATAMLAAPSWVDSAPSGLDLPPALQGELDNGLPVLYVGDELPLTTIVVFIGYGRLHEGGKTAGLGSLMAETLTLCGSRKYPGRAIHEAVESMGGSLSIDASWEHIVISIKVLDRFTDRAFDIISDLTLNPNYNAADMEKARGILVDGIKRKLTIRVHRF